MSPGEAAGAAACGRKRPSRQLRTRAERLAELGVADIRVDSDANTRTATDALRVDADQLTARISRALGKLRTARQAGQAQTANALREQIDTLRQQRTDINTACNRRSRSGNPIALLPVRGEDREHVISNVAVAVVEAESDDARRDLRFA
jgi:hypothetical protein